MRVAFPLDRPFPVIELDEVDSTNLEALRRVAAGSLDNAWLIARRQTAGRGRSGRSWHSADGNLAASLTIFPGCAASIMPELSLVTGVALHAALSSCLPPSSDGARPLRLKWPNDVLAGDGKLAGVLIESTSAGNRAGPIAVIGIGVNLCSAPQIDGRATIAARDLGISLDARTLLGHVDRKMRRWLDIWLGAAGFARVREAWLERCGPLGVPVTVDTGSEMIAGTFAGLDETGALLIDSVPANSKHRRRITFGDVSLMPLKGEGST